VLAQQIEMAQQQKQAIKKAIEKAESEVKKKRGRKPKEPLPVKAKSPLDVDTEATESRSVAARRSLLSDIDELENLCC
jgi:hypothetical protein